MALICSVIVCAHSEAEDVAGCLHSLRAQSRLPDEILVVDNASTDGTRAVAEGVAGVRLALRANVDVALTLFRNGCWQAPEAPT